MTEKREAKDHTAYNGYIHTSYSYGRALHDMAPLSAAAYGAAATGAPAIAPAYLSIDPPHEA